MFLLLLLLKIVRRAILRVPCSAQTGAITTHGEENLTPISIQGNSDIQSKSPRKECESRIYEFCKDEVMFEGRDSLRFETLDGESTR